MPIRIEVKNISTAMTDARVQIALAAVQASQAETQVAWAGLFPDLALNYTYGIDAPQFAVNGPDGVKNLGYMVMPKFGHGKMAGIPVTDTQGFGIPTKGGDHEDAAKFLAFMHSKERVQAMWTLSKQIPANTTS